MVLKEVGDLDCKGCDDCEDKEDLIEVTVTVLTQIEEKTVEIEEYSPVQAVLEAAGIKCGPDVKFYLDGEEVSLCSTVWEGDTIQVITPAA